MQVYLIHDVVSPATTSFIIERLNEAAADEVMTIQIHLNLGGYIDSANLLIKALTESKATVTLEFEGYAMSAGAFIYIYFALYPARNITLVSKDSKTLFVYHRPRGFLPDGTIHFTEVGVDGEECSLEYWSVMYDTLFKDLLEKLKIIVKEEPENQSTLQELQHLKDGYYKNFDTIFSNELLKRLL